MRVPTENKHLNHIQPLLSRGFSLVELMISMVIGLIVVSALIQLFSNFSHMNRTQRGLANIQENGRFIAAKMQMDIENVGFQPCATISMESPQLIDKGFAKRPMINYTAATLGLPTGAVDPQYFIQGHECDASGTCTPSLRNFPGGDPSPFIPAAGTTEGSRAYKTDVLTIRFLSSEPAFVDDSLQASTTSEFSLNQVLQDPPLSWETGDTILVSNCSKSFIVNAQGVTENRLKISHPLVSVSWASKASYTSVYNFTKQFKTVTYYVALKANNANNQVLTSSLYRIENGSEPQEVVEGVERLDLTYGVQFVDGTMAFLTSNQWWKSFEQ